MAKSKTEKKADASKQRVVVRNRKAAHDYELLDELECGIVLLGSEVKSIRNNKVTIDEAYAKLQNGELWLLNADIAEYPQASYMNHERKRERKLLVRKAQIRKVAETAEHEGLTMVPLSVYFERGLVKIKLAVARGRKKHDKRDKLKAKVDAREMRAAKQVRLSRD
jgi:SsrA-binding protein